MSNSWTARNHDLLRQGSRDLKAAGGHRVVVLGNSDLTTGSASCLLCRRLLVSGVPFEQTEAAAAASDKWTKRSAYATPPRTCHERTYCLTAASRVGVATPWYRRTPTALDRGRSRPDRDAAAPRLAAEHREQLEAELAEVMPVTRTGARKPTR